MPPSLPNQNQNQNPHAPRLGLPPIPPPRNRGNDPDLHGFLNGFRIPTWSTTASNPMYARVAHRRAVAASAAGGGGAGGAAVENALRSVLDRVGNAAATATASGSGSAAAGAAANTGDEERVRPLEDPHLVGEEAASRARRARLARESGDDILLNEDRRWDWFLGKSALCGCQPPRPIPSSFPAQSPLTHGHPGLFELSRGTVYSVQEWCWLGAVLRCVVLYRVMQCCVADGAPYVAQMKDREERDRSWANFRREYESRNRRKFARYIGRR